MNNTHAVIEAVLGIPSGFMRTPKFAVTSPSAQWHNSTYTLPQNPTVWLELCLALYAISIFGPQYAPGRGLDGLLVTALRHWVWIPCGACVYPGLGNGAGASPPNR